MSDNIAFQSAISLREKLVSRQISVVELCNLFLERIRIYHHRSKAFIEVSNDRAKAAANMRDRKAESGDIGPLHGLPYGLKDVINFKGVCTTGGSRVLQDNVATENAVCVEALERAGGVFLGKTNLHEFAYGATGENEIYGTPVNAYDETRLACGSSSGSAAAVAFGLCPFALGTDTGGSVRVPAVLNGLVGLKPTLGRVSTRGVLPYCWTFDHVGTVTRTVADAALLLESIAGYDRLDPATSNEPVGSYLSTLDSDVVGVRVGIPESFFFERADPEVLAASEAVLRYLETSGAKIRRVSTPSMAHSRAVSLTVQMPEALSYHRRYLEQRGELYSRDFRAGLALGQCLLAEHYVRARRFVELYRRQMNVLFEDVDVLLTPATPIIAPKIGTVKVKLDGIEEAIGNTLTRYTTFFNMTGHPAITLPVGLHSEGLPVGIQIVARPFEEETLFATAAHVERSEVFKIQGPPIA